MRAASRREPLALRRSDGTHGARRRATGPRRLPGLLPLLLLVSSCKLQEVTIPLGEEVVVVQGVLTLDTTAAAQYVVVERSITGTMVIPDQDSLRGPPRPPLPISGASVVVTRDDGASVVFTEIPDTLGVYRLPRAAAPGFLAAGRVYRLRVVTPDGQVVTGRTRMPDFPVVAGIPADGAVFDRDRDTLDVTWSGAAGTKGVFVQVRPRDLQRRLTLILFTDSTKFRVSGRLPLPFEADTLPPWVWVAGMRQTFTVAAMDTSFFNFFRTGNDPFTGSGFINGVEGGLGVFGSMAPVNRTYVVRGDMDHPYEGRYRLDYTPSSGGRAFTAELDLYVNRDRPAPVLVNAIGRVTQGYFSGGLALEAAGRISAAETLHLWVIDTETGAEQPRILLVGGFDPNGAATGTVRDRDGATIGTYTLKMLP